MACGHAKEALEDVTNHEAVAHLEYLFCQTVTNGKRSNLNYKFNLI